MWTRCKALLPGRTRLQGGGCGVRPCMRGRRGNAPFGRPLRRVRRAVVLGQGEPVSVGGNYLFTGRLQWTPGGSEEVVERHGHRLARAGRGLLLLA